MPLNSSGTALLLSPRLQLLSKVEDKFTDKKHRKPGEGNGHEDADVGGGCPPLETGPTPEPADESRQRDGQETKSPQFFFCEPQEDSP